MQGTPREKSWLIKIGFILSGVTGLVIVGAAFLYVWLLASDQLGTFRNAANVADLDNDGDLDVIQSNARYESEFSFFSEITLWINQGEGKFTPSKIEGNLAIAAGDVDQDGDNDLMALPPPVLRIYLNQGGVQGGTVGEFKVNQSFTPPVSLPDHGGLQGTVQ